MPGSAHRLSKHPRWLIWAQDIKTRQVLAEGIFFYHFPFCDFMDNALLWTWCSVKMYIWGHLIGDVTCCFKPHECFINLLLICFRFFRFWLLGRKLNSFWGLGCVLWEVVLELDTTDLGNEKVRKSLLHFYQEPKTAKETVPWFIILLAGKTST